MTKYLDDGLASIATIVRGNQTDPAVTQAVADLQNRLAVDEASDADVKVLTDTLIKQLASYPATGIPIATPVPTPVPTGTPAPTSAPSSTPAPTSAPVPTPIP